MTYSHTVTESTTRRVVDLLDNLDVTDPEQAPYDVPVTITPACSRCGRFISWDVVCQTLDVLTHPGHDVIREWHDSHPECGKVETRDVVRVVMS